MKNWQRGILQLPLLLGLTVLCTAKPKINPLDRLTPVPDNEPIPVIDFFRPPVFAHPELNPAGTHFAAIFASGRDRHDLVTMELSTGKVERLTGGENYDVACFEWFGNDQILFKITQGEIYASGLYAASLSQLKGVYALQRDNVVIPIGSPRANPDHLILWIKKSMKDNGADGGVCRINTAKHFSASPAIFNFNGTDDGLRAFVVRNYPTPKPGDVSAYLSDVNGELAFAITSKDGVDRLHRLVDNKWILSPVDLDHYDLIGAGDKPGEIIVHGSNKDDRPGALHVMNAETAELGAVLAEDEKYDLKNVRIVRDPVDDHIMGIQYRNIQQGSIWIDSKYKQLQASLGRTFPGQIVTILGSDKLQQRFFVRTSSDLNPGTYYYIQSGVEPIGFAKIAERAPWIDSKRMRPMNKLTYKARDGKPIEGLVTLPAGASKASPAPLVVIPHGGLSTNDSWSWDPEAQFLASRGYAVFQPNYRGSTGTEWRFPDEDLWAFRKMHDDVTDGVKQLLKTGLIDPERIAIMGTDFGGYLAVCGAAYEPDLYRCAVTICGIFDWEQVTKELRKKEYNQISYGILRRRIGDPDKQRELFEYISPVKAVAQIKAPIFVAHIEAIFSRLPESRRFIAELKRHKIPFEKQIGHVENSGFYKLENKVELYSAIETFLNKNLAPRPKK